MRKIKVLYNYGGSPSRERRIEPGEYAVNDSALFGLAEYLLKHGHAVEIKPPPKPVKKSKPKPVVEVEAPPVEEDDNDEAPPPQPRTKRGRFTRS